MPSCLPCGLGAANAPPALGAVGAAGPFQPVPSLRLALPLWPTSCCSVGGEVPQGRHAGRHGVSCRALAAVCLQNRSNETRLNIHLSDWITRVPICCLHCQRRSGVNPPLVAAHASSSSAVLDGSQRCIIGTYITPALLQILHSGIRQPGGAPDPAAVRHAGVQGCQLSTGGVVSVVV